VGAAFAFALEMMTLVAVFGLETITMSLVFGAFGVACATIVVNPWLTLVGVALTLVATRWAYAPRVLVAPSPTDGPASTTRVAGASES
jgi:hypothetical protein